MQIKIHDIATDGLPDMEALTGRVAFIFDGCIVSGWPLRDDSGEVVWEADSDVGCGREFYHVTQWVEFPITIWEMKSHGKPTIQYEFAYKDLRAVCSHDRSTITLSVGTVGRMDYAYETWGLVKGEWEHRQSGGWFSAAQRLDALIEEVEKEPEFTAWLAACAGK
jgi:hypothetical protein